ncbi:MAG TPA: hypothetical protein VMU73_04940 [Gaiellaceae bacterium]|nr:hypothetical protein [Gaiellaceae bacterium]
MTSARALGLQDDFVWAFAALFFAIAILFATALLFNDSIPCPYRLRQVVPLVLLGVADLLSYRPMLWVRLRDVRGRGTVARRRGQDRGARGQAGRLGLDTYIGNQRSADEVVSNGFGW